jgi:hypothetical protein
VLEVPHEWRGIEEVDGGNTQTDLVGEGHLSLRVASGR